MSEVPQLLLTQMSEVYFLSSNTKLRPKIDQKLEDVFSTLCSDFREVVEERGVVKSDLAQTHSEGGNSWMR